MTTETPLYPLTDEQRMIVDTVDDITDTYDHEYWLNSANSNQFPDELWDTLGELGFHGINIPEEYGGQGMGMSEMALLMERLATHGVPSLFLVVSSTMAPIPIKNHGSEDLKERFLPSLAKGETKFAFAITEPEAGTNTFKITTHADRNGDEYIVNGQKTFISGAKDADYIQLVSRTTPYEEVKGTDRRQGITLLAIPTDADGLQMDPLDLAVPEPVKQYSVYFDDVHVPVENRIGEEGRGIFHVFDALNPERIVTGALGIGIGRFALARAVEYANERVVFDEPIGSYQGVQHPLARAKVQLELAGLANMRAAEAFETDADNAGAYANMAKFAASEAGDQAVDAAIQSHGGNAFSPDYGVINIQPFARLLRLAPINNEMVLNYIGENLLGLPRSY